MMKAIYVVTRIVCNPAGGVPRPNLGVHRNLADAERHFEGVLSDRLERGWKLVYRCNELTAIPEVRRMAHITRDYMRDKIYKQTETESLRLEVWRP